MVETDKEYKKLRKNVLIILEENEYTPLKAKQIHDMLPLTQRMKFSVQSIVNTLTFLRWKRRAKAVYNGPSKSFKYAIGGRP